MTKNSSPSDATSRTRMLAYSGNMTVNHSLAWGHFGRTLILVQAPGIPGDADWAEFLADSHRDPGEVILVIAGETKLSPKQRADVQAWQERHGTPSVLVTDSLVARGVAKALGWFGVKITAFARKDIDQALQRAKVVASDRGAVKDLIACMMAALDESREDSLAG
jgi:hypothetical protein